MKDFKELLQKIGEIGYVEEINQSIVHVKGLPSVQTNEIVIFESGDLGQVMGLKKEIIEVILLSKNSVRVGSKVARTSQSLEVAVGDELLGKVIDPLGFSLDHLNPFPEPETKRSIDNYPLGIEYRKRIDVPCETGNSMVDMLIPLGEGQRELILGDRKTGKTVFLLKTLLAQARKGTICIYAAIGKKKTDIKKVDEYLVANGISKSTVVVAASSEDPAGIIFLTPYTAMTIAEYFKDHGRNVLIVLDDLSTHAKYYREISLIAKRFPGRNSYPGDIFYTHAKLLERAGNFKTDKGQVSITCMPVAETTEGDITGYIQTNLMSMTDGHIYFDSDLFSKGRRPAINPFLSVTRVGRQTQTTLRREINRELISFLTLFEKMQRFVHFGAELSGTVKSTLNTGEKILAFFNYTSEDIMESNLQTFLFCLLWIGLWQEKTVAQMKFDMNKINVLYKTDAQIHRHIDDIIKNTEGFNELLGKMSKRINEYQSMMSVVIPNQTQIKTQPGLDGDKKEPIRNATQNVAGGEVKTKDNTINSKS